MKYANSLKYINSFEMADKLSDISTKRVRKLCEDLGRVNVGSRFIVVPSGCAGHATAVMLESVIKKAGYRVGRITSESDFESRSMVYLDGELADIEDYNKCVAEIKGIVSKEVDANYLRQEICFALSLLLCQLNGCEFIILEALSGEGYSFDALCAPYELVIAPTVYSKDGNEETKHICDAIKRGVREVVSGNQKSSVYGVISNACMLAGVRINVTAKPTLQIKETTARRVVFSYADRDGYVIKSPSHILRDCAMLVIESALALRRDGIKMPWGSIALGLENAQNTGCFDMLSISPAVLVDCASQKQELESVIETFEETVGSFSRLTICIKAGDKSELPCQLSAFEGRKIERLIVCGDLDEDDVSLKCVCADVSVCGTVKLAAKHVHKASMENLTVLCVGGVAFAAEIKNEFIRLMGL